ncbi:MULTISPECIES: hypothetical protein [Cytobacillus]|uniref:hypothetical protein n=1 Tax=Cytobacillus TaxID=2675230 RepID=UPI002480D9F0|nr:hypothetical protein [Cytobacillus kochii]
MAIALIGCQLQQGETMVLLDEKISEIKISESNGTGEMNEEINLSIKEEELLDLPFCYIRKGQYH